MLFSGEYLSMVEYSALMGINDSELNPAWPRGQTVSRSVPPMKAGDLCIPLLDADGKQVLCKVIRQNPFVVSYLTPGLLAETSDKYATPTSFTYYETHTLSSALEPNYDWLNMVTDKIELNHCSEWLRWGFSLWGLCVISTSPITMIGTDITADDGFLLAPTDYYLYPHSASGAYVSEDDDGVEISVTLGAKNFILTLTHPFVSGSTICSLAESAGIICHRTQTSNIYDTYYHDYNARSIKEYYASDIKITPLSPVTFYIGVIGEILTGPQYALPSGRTSLTSAVGVF
jgi:hypothetical protein